MLDSLNIPMIGRLHQGRDECKNLIQILIEMIKDGCMLNITASMLTPRDEFINDIW